MEPAAAGVLYAAENLIQGAAALVKGITHPTLPIKANLTRIGSVPLQRSQHTISVVKGRAYVFGGEIANDTLADNAMHIIILPSSGVLDADYTSIPARSANGLDDVPNARKGHSATVIGDRIYIFGGEGVGVENEPGRIWVYDTISNTWSFLDPAAGTLFPDQRVGHSAVSSDLPGPQTTTFRESAPQAPADPAKVVPEPAEADSWGTIFVAGGIEVESKKLAVEALAFDVRTRTWRNLPSPPSREGARLSLIGDRLYTYGGKEGELRNSDTTERLDVSRVWTHAAGGPPPLATGWIWEEVSHSKPESEMATTPVRPTPRSNSGLVGLTTGQGRHYLLAIGGQGDAGDLVDDIWALQLPSEKSTAAATKDGIRAGIKRDTHESQWAEVLYKYVDTKGEEVTGELSRNHQGVGKRRNFAVAKGTEVDGATAVVWGGVDADGQTLGDGWMITVDR